MHKFTESITVFLTLRYSQLFTPNTFHHPCLMSLGPTSTSDQHPTNWRLQNKFYYPSADSYNCFLINTCTSLLTWFVLDTTLKNISLIRQRPALWSEETHNRWQIAGRPSRLQLGRKPTWAGFEDTADSFGETLLGYSSCWWELKGCCPALSR